MSTYTLYYSPGAASMAVHWMLIEARIPFEAKLVNIDEGAQHDPEYRRLNPSGRVPTLIVDGVPRHESTALLMLLAERHPEAGLAPAPGTPERGEWYEWMVYFANTLLPAMRDWFYCDSDGDPAGAEAVRALANLRIAQSLDRMGEQLADGREYLIGGKLSTVDFLAVMLMRWTRNLPPKATDRANLMPYITRLRALPSFVELNEREGLTNWSNPAS
jgi:glutathione S-transferase